MIHLRGISAALACAVVSGTVACNTAPGAVFHVDPPQAFFDAPASITITGLHPGGSVDVRASTRDAGGTLWSSFATFKADPGGRVDLGTTAPSAGTYSGIDPMGLFWSMSPNNSSVGAYEFPADGQHVALSAIETGELVATSSMVRYQASAAVTTREITLAEAGFFGRYDSPANLVGRQTAVLAFGGSGGGLGEADVAYALATHGYPALAIAYFNEPGLPQRLEDIPLEYFKRALDWLAAQPAVDPRHIVVYGVSRGSEVALLLGVHYPDLVHGVIAMVPSNVAICSFPGCRGPAWTLDGEPIPYTSEFDNPAPDDVVAAVIPVERINGPILLDCGGSDQVWVSCTYADAIIDRLDANHDPYPHELLEYLDAGHGIGNPLPYVPLVEPPQIAGAYPQSNARAREEVWPAVLDFLARQ